MAPRILHQKNHKFRFELSDFQAVIKYFRDESKL